MAGYTSSFRFPGQTSSSMRKSVTQLSSYANMHFLFPSFAPLSAFNTQQYRQLTPSDLMAQAFDAKNTMCSVDPRHGRYLSVQAVFRGDLSSQECEQRVRSTVDKNSSYFVEWIPKSFLVSFSKSAPS